MARFRWPMAFAILLLAGLAGSGCSVLPGSGAAVAELPPLRLANGVVTLDDVPALAPSPELTALTEPMRAFVARYAPRTLAPRQRLNSLHEAIKGPGMLAVGYDPFADGDAETVFDSGAANCLSYAHLFVALAREAGLNASYQWLEVRPQWTRLGERVAVSLHVNVLVKVSAGEQYMVDIDPLQPRDIAASRKLGDRDARALQHNNLAMAALAGAEPEVAWANAIRALQLSPDLPELWVNLAAVYRHAEQFSAAENALFQALKIDSGERSAMNNLVVLYSQLGREGEREFWVERVNRHRDLNPYYHAWLGDKAGEEEDWTTALDHYRQALKLEPKNSRLLYSTGIIHFRLAQYDAAERLVERAIATATLRPDILDYQVQLAAVRRRQLADTH
ncbi:tetratricopeptide repeat protein [Kineobactrum sediminis]|nr:tetratricopeptide repeat protein [Kineobactrum sediminis]